MHLEEITPGDLLKFAVWHACEVLYMGHARIDPDKEIRRSSWLNIVGRTRDTVDQRSGVPIEGLRFFPDACGLWVSD